MVPPDEDAATTPLSGPLPRADVPRTFASDLVVAGRYRILRFLAQGGMGEVYEAEDLELKEPVALKTIRPEIAGDERMIERFKREILLARRVTHRNVARIFDLGSHAGTDRTVAFLTMELLRGETLSERLRRAGRMTKQEALPLVVQMVSGLAAAHRAGIVHRDFKSANVLLVPADAPGSPRVVVTDFGLARSRAGEPTQTTATDTGFTTGTPAYMAPEQVEGGAITPAVDVYALGVVMYEMTTGTLPFVGETLLATAAKRLTTSATPPRTHAPDLDPAFEAVILRCLEREPARRYAGAEDVAAALRGDQGRGRALRWAAASAGGVVLLLAAALGYRMRRSEGPPPPAPVAAPAAAVTTRRSVAVLGFKNLSGHTETDWLSTALAEMLATELAAGERLRTIPGENVARMRADLSLPDAESLSKDTLARVRAHLGVDAVVLGSYLALGGASGGRLRLDLRIQDALAGDTIAAVAEQGTEADLFDLVSRVGGRLREKLGVGELSVEQAGAARAALPANAEAARLYSEGIAKLRVFDPLAARDRLERALAAGPDQALAHSALAEAWSALGYEGRAQQEARKAFEVSRGLSREERLIIEGRFREATREWDQAVAVYRTLFGFFPDNLDYGLRLAAAEAAARRGPEALAAVESLRTLPPPASEDPRIDLAEAQAAAAATEFRKQQAAAARAARKGAQRGARQLVARAQLEEASAFASLGQLDDAATAALRARDSFEAAGDVGGVAGALFNLATARWQQGRFTEAIEAAQGALAGFRRIGNKSREGWVLNRLAVLLHYRGELKAATNTFQAALASFIEVGDRAGEVGIYVNTARLLRDQGNLLGAHGRHDQALALGRAIGNRNYLAHALFGLGETLMTEGRLDEARKAHEEALELWKGLERKGPVAESHAVLASILVEEGRAAAAEPLARQAVSEFQAQRSLFNEANAQAVLARALLAQGRTAEADDAARHADALAQGTEHRVFRLNAAIIAALCRARAGDPAAATRMLDSVAAEARAAGLPAAELEVRLALGEIELGSGHAAEGRTRLASLERDAKAKGFGLVARKAAAARRQGAGG